MINLKIETKITLVHEESATDIYLIAKAHFICVALDINLFY